MSPQEALLSAGTAGAGRQVGAADEAVATVPASDERSALIPPPKAGFALHVLFGATIRVWTSWPPFSARKLRRFTGRGFGAPEIRDRSVKLLTPVRVPALHLHRRVSVSQALTRRSIAAAVPAWPGSQRFKIYGVIALSSSI